METGMDPEPSGGEQRLSDKILQGIVGKPLDIHKPSLQGIFYGSFQGFHLFYTTATELIEDIVREFPRSTVFTGRLVFRNETPFQRILHNESAHAIQRRLQWAGVTSVILPIRVNL